MTVEHSLADVLTIQRDGEDTVTAVFQSLGNGRGRLFVESFGDAFSAFWNAMLTAR